MNVLENKTVYTCGYCSRYYLQKHHATKHEKHCKNNPNNNHKCFGCKNLLNEQLDLTPNCTYSSNINLCKCAVTDRYMYSYGAEKGTVLQRLGELDQGDYNFIRMPLECEHFKTIDELPNWSF